MNPILEKIKKLLRMQRGGTPDEIATALRLAQELAQKHGIDLASVDPNEQTDSVPIGHVEQVLTSRLPAEAKFAAAILVNFFKVQIVIAQKYNVRTFSRVYVLNLVGTNWDCQVAQYVFIFLQRAFRSAWTNRQNRRLKNRYAFLNGMFLGLATKLERERTIPEGKGLIVLERGLQLRKDYVAKHWPNSKDKPLDEDDSDAFASRVAGIMAGKQTEIRSSLKGGAPAPARPSLPPPVGQMSLL
jgi:hypothetical protein